MQIYAQDFFAWPYDDALKWMDDAFFEVKKDHQKVLIAYGSHKDQVITLGRNKDINVLDESLLISGVMIRKLDRGGGITAHEPGQLVLYPVLDIAYHHLSVLELLELMKLAMVTFLSAIGIESQTEGQGIFVKQEKIGFWGLRIKEGITSHGLALNLFNQAQIFSRFDPCGIKALPVTSSVHHVRLPGSIEYYANMLKEYFVEELLIKCG